MSIHLSHARLAILTISVAALLGACSASTAGAPATAAAPTSVSAAAVAPSSLSVAGATGAAAPVAGGDTRAACSIVTSSAVSTATGFAVAKSSGAAGQCIFQNADSSQYLTVLIYGSQADMAVMLEAEPGGEHVVGLGDDAFWSQLGGLLFVRKGDRALAFLDPDLGASSLTDTSGRDALVALARTALPNL
jgi:hypothetical protein